MAGVDKGDQLRKYYSVRLKCNKNYKYIFWFLFDVSITNAFILNKFTVTTQSSLHYSRLKQFRVALAKRLLGDYCSRQTTGRPSILVVSRAIRVFNVWRRARILAARVVGENTSGVLRTLFVCSAGMLAAIRLQNY